MALSQCLEDSPAWRVLSKGEREVNLEELYNERHRLALEELLSGGVDSYLEFLKKEKIPNFLSDEEIKHISLSAVVPKAFSVAGDDAPFEHSVSSSMDCSSVTYFPDVSDVEPPVLELGWPAFTTGSFRGVTRAVAHFQPSYGDCIYSCKDAARKMIKGAKELIAIVTDSLTDLDIFRDLQEACTRRRVPVYILLDQVSVPSFLQMCSNLSVRLEELRLMRVRTITGCAYYMRSGARITGKVHERFMLIDGHKVATGSYRFNWTDGKLNTSNLIELTGQITEKFDEEFRILYAQSLPLNPRECPFNKHNSGIFDHLLLKLPSTPPIQTPKAAAPNQGHMTSTPTRAERMNKGAPQLPPKAEGTSLKSCPNSDASTLRDEWMKQDLFQDELVCEGPAPPLASAQPLLEAGGCLAPAVVGAPTSTCHISTQTGNQSVDKSVQTDRSTKHQSSGCSPLPSTACAVTNFETATSSASSTSSSIQPDVKLGLRPPIRSGPVPMPSNLKESFRKLSKERQGHYASIRSKLDNMMTMLSHRRELVDLTNLALSPGLRRRNAHQQSRRAAEVMMETTFTGTWPRSRALQ